MFWRRSRRGVRADLAVPLKVLDDAQTWVDWSVLDLFLGCANQAYGGQPAMRERMALP